MTSRFAAATAAATIAAAALLAAPPASAQSKIVAGTLTCQGQGTVGLIVGSKESLRCAYKPAGTGATQSYSGSVTKIGLDVGIKGKSTIVWTVLGSTTSLGRGALAGNYAGVSASASVAVGGGANALVGGSNDSVVLQPLSVQGQQGVNLAVGVAGLALTLNP